MSVQPGSILFACKLEWSSAAGSRPVIVVLAEFFAQVAPAYAAGAGLSLLVEQMLQPAPAVLGRPWKSTAAHLGLWTAAFCIELALFQRPYFASLLVLATLALLTIVSNTKLRSLREPFVYHDFEYFVDMLRHPRLYLPYFGILRALLAAAAFAAAFYLGFILEPALPASTGLAGFATGLIVLAGMGAGLLWISALRPQPSSFEPMEELRSHGLLASLWRQALAQHGSAPTLQASRFAVAGQAIAGRGLPDVVLVVQSESFFDARRLFAGVRPQVLREFDAIKAFSACHGLLEVPAWGANTVRTEFSFLSALEAESLGVHRFNPYRSLAKRGVPTLAGFLKHLGYRTICVHPYPATFYSRNKIFPLLGFDEFIDIRDFSGAASVGPYVGDVELAEKVCGLLERHSGRRLFVFVITMENHGPMHLERVAPEDLARLYDLPPPAGFDDLSVYLKHLGNADLMIGMLRERLERDTRDNWLCWYGDHVPVLSDVYEATGFDDGRTDYFIWGKGRTPHGAIEHNLKVEDLGVVFLQQAGVLVSR